MATGTIKIKGQRFVLVAEAEYERMRDLTDELLSGDGPPIPKPDSKGNVPAVEYMRAGLARRIIRHRRQNGLTQAELAARAGIRPETLCRIEKGKMTPSTLIFQRIQKALEKAELSSSI